MIRRRVVVHGAVQGVFFRDSCRREALDAGVSGWVRNLPDGTVEAAFEGVAESVDALCAWCRQGPPHALVKRRRRGDRAAGRGTRIHRSPLIGWVQLRHRRAVIV